MQESTESGNGTPDTWLTVTQPPISSIIKPAEAKARTPEKWGSLSRINLSVAYPATHLLYRGGKSTCKRCSMARKPDPSRIRNIYQTIERNPGVRAGAIARLLGIVLPLLNPFYIDDKPCKTPYY